MEHFYSILYTVSDFVSLNGIIFANATSRISENTAIFETVLEFFFFKNRKFAQIKTKSNYSINFEAQNRNIEFRFFFFISKYVGLSW